ncbi:MAG: hypothetical protein AAF802_07260 [Planctomycetota bacterium]
MKRLFAAGLVLCLAISTGCAPKEAGIVVDKDEAAQYNVPPEAYEAATAGMESAAKKNRGK